MSNTFVGMPAFPEACGRRWRTPSCGTTWRMAAGKSSPSTQEEQLEAEVADLTTALGVAAVERRVWKKSAEGRLGPSRTSR
jgi:hypothetical protein